MMSVKPSVISAKSSQNFNKNILVEILLNASTSLSVKEIRAALRHHMKKQPEYIIVRLLRELLNEGIITYRKGQWSLSQNYLHLSQKKKRHLQFTVKPPILSPIGSSILRFPSDGRNGLVSAQNLKETIIKENAAPDNQLKRSGPWSSFRSLLAYYKECIRNEEGAEASAFLNEHTTRFLYFHKIGLWYPRAGRPWRYAIPIGEHIADFIKELSKIGDGNIVVLGYPLQAVYIRKENEPDIALLRPIFQYVLESNFSQSALNLFTDEARIEICLDWLKYAFPHHDQQCSFLSACGLINRPRPDDEALGMEAGDGNPSLDSLVSALSAFLPKSIKEPLQIDMISSNSLHIPFETGIYNKAVIMLGRRTKYTKTLLNELSFIEKLDDNILDSTSLRHIFRHTREETLSPYKEALHESLVADTMPLNADQRKSVAALISQDTSIVTGPPGTGKSQVICSAIANARIRGETVLFSSRNHKAIDAVVERLKDNQNRSLIIRTNSKEDPSLNYTFTTAIRDLLANNIDQTSGDKLKKVIEKIMLLLEQRGEQALLAYTIQSLRDELGEIEERMAYLGGNMLHETKTILYNNSSRFPRKAIENIKKIALDSTKLGTKSNILFRVLRFVRILTITPQWMFAHLRLREFPGLDGLPLVPSFWGTTSYATVLQKIFEASEYSKLREKAIPIIAKRKEYPPLEEIISFIKDKSERISLITPEALSLHLDSRAGLLPDSKFRDRLASLKVALQAKKSGFSGDKELEETERVLKENIPFLLRHFPCWAVTNLSVGSRLPLSPGIFDLAIIDEASQSDIASAIPILFRAKKAAVVGDPNQLTHTTKLSIAKDSLLRKRAGLIKLDDMKFSYRDTSLYNLFAQSIHVVPIFLSDTYRSVDSIADYSNNTFYSGRLRVATNISTLNTPTSTLSRKFCTS